MTYPEQLAREAVPCLFASCGKHRENLAGEGTDSLCGNCERRSAVEAAIREAIEACANRCELGAAATQRVHVAMASGWLQAATAIRALLTEETP